MAKVDDFIGLAQKYAGDVDFLVVYLREAHPIDGWSLAQVKHPTYQHTTLGERLANARVLRGYIEKSLCPLVADGMRDEALHAYGAFPERLCVLMNSRVLYEGKMGPFGYDLNELDRCLDNILTKSQ